VAVSGTTMDYFTGLPLATTALSTEGMDPQLTGTSGSDGTYTLDQVPPGSLFYVDTSRPNYRPTRNDAVTVADLDLSAQNLYVVSTADASRQYASLGMTPTLGTSILIGNLIRNNGTPLEGTPLADITLVDDLGAPVGLGPYFFGEAGDIVDNATLAVSTAYGTPAMARVAFLDVPPGTYTLKVNYTAGTGGGGGGGGGGGTTIRTYIVPFLSGADSAELVSTGGQDDDGTPTGNLTFTTNIYPMLQKAANGGLGCANCHTAGGLNPNMQFDLPAADVYTSLMAAPGDIVVATPADSLLLMKPLYETPPNHPNATFASIADPNYITIMNWITAGALQ